jgi:hypothetical protein
VGHTHEDIDAKFAKIWIAARDNHVLTPNSYKELILNALCPTDSESLPCRVVDVFAIPNYVKYIEGHIDKNFGTWTKLEQSQLGWKFEYDERTELFPCAVRTHYRAYSSEFVHELFVQETSDTKLAVTKTQIKWRPLEKYINAKDRNDFKKRGIENQNQDDLTYKMPSGMFLLQQLPSGMLEPLPFIIQSRKSLENTIDKFKKQFPNEKKLICEWDNFANQIAPGDDNVLKYINEAPSYYRIPLIDKLFYYREEDKITNLYTNRCKLYGGKSLAFQIYDCDTTDFVKWSCRNFKDNTRADQPRTSIVDSITGDTHIVSLRKGYSKISENPYNEKKRSELESMVKDRKIKFKKGESKNVASLIEALLKYDAEAQVHNMDGSPSIVNENEILNKNNKKIRK